MRDVAAVRGRRRSTSGSIARFNGKPSLNIGVIKQAVANPLELSKAVRAEVAKINETLPTGMKLDRRLRHVGVHRPLDLRPVFRTIGEAIAAGRAGDLLLPAHCARRSSRS